MSSNAPNSGAAAQGLDLDEVLDQHAELRDVLAQLRSARDAAILSGLLQRLHDLLQSHFAQEEADPELQRVLEPCVDASGTRGRSPFDEHGSILAALDQLVERVEQSDERSVDPFAEEVSALLARIEAHDAREMRLFGDRIDTAASAGTRAPGSGALEVNLRRTAVDVVIPSEHAVLLEMTATRYGVHENTRKLLREINHRYVSWPETLEELHRRAMGDLPYYLEHERAPDAIHVFVALYARVVEQARTDPVRESAVRQWLYFLEKVVDTSGDALTRLVPAMKAAISRLEVILHESPRLAVCVSARLRHFARRLLAAAPEDGEDLQQRVLSLLVATLRAVYTEWLAQPDPEEWWRAHGGAAPVPGAFAAISHAHHRNSLARLERLASGPPPLASRADALFALPDDARIERGHLDATAHIGPAGKAPAGPERIARIQWLIWILSIAALESIHRQALTEIDHAYRGALEQADDATFVPLVRETFAALRRSPLASSPAAFGLLSRIGVEVMRHGDPERAERVIDSLIDWGLPGPAFAGFTDEWRVRIDPGHLPAIRGYMAVIRENPALARRLISALIVHLKVGGVFVADTDLFQKEVSLLLNSDIAPVYHPIKQLLRLFPVYFNDIGAEGELRDVSSRIDEIQARKDPLCHFLRKQCHVECNPRLIAFIEAIGAYWTSGDPAPLRPFLPQALYDRVAAGEGRSGAERAFALLAEPEGVRALFALGPEALDERLRGLRDVRPVDREKAGLLVRLRRLVSQKYALDHEDLLERLASFHAVEPHERAALRSALDAQQHEEALAVLLDVLERVKEIVTRPEQTRGHEEIHRKRHIAVGIPSMYGRYREEKFEALGLGFRIESLASALFERMLGEDDVETATRDALRKTARRLRLLLRAVRVDGCHGRGLELGTAMLEHALDAPDTRIDQYVNVFQLLSRSIEQLIRIRLVEPYDGVLDRILMQSRGRDVATPPDTDTDRENRLKTSEAFLRSAIASSFGLQPLDRLVSQMLRTLVLARDQLDPATLRLLVGFDLERSCVPIDAQGSALDNPVFLGNKGHLIKQLSLHGLPVPPGFILTTELFRCRTVTQRCASLRRALLERIRSQIVRIERATGARFGDPQRPLLLSVRSSAAFSMPGVLDTFLDVGVNESIVEGLAAHSRSPWGAWDAYRRFVQFWGMGHGIARDRFDSLMRSRKALTGVARKAEMPADAMRDLAVHYRHFVEAEGVAIPDDPTAQLERCIDLVLASWHAEKARVYRAELQIADDWGTAVVVQSMVYGNLDSRSGTGVAFTCDPRSPSDDVRLHGDFVAQGQGDDVVSGLVATFPLSEAQRTAERPDTSRSLERDFPRIYGALLDHARMLIRHQGMFHQEIEFTFESDEPADLYVLQTRDVVMAELSSVTAFVPGPSLERDRLATGIGAGGGALSGRVARNAEDIAELRRRFPSDPILLIRRDTVPDDIPLILAVDGLLTALGGATSHAALVAQRLGKSCVVGCRELQVDEQGSSRIGERSIAKGEFLSISGIDGSIYRGRHAATTVRRRRLL
jgi:pyruvate, orthophosphate dikinase